jgi:hypothetical protein
MSFSRQTLFDACHVLPQCLTQTQMDTLMLRLELDHLVARRNNEGKESRANELLQHLLANPTAQVNGRSLARLVVEEAVRIVSSLPGPAEEGVSGKLLRSLQRDGFTVDDGRLRPALPQDLDLPAADDEVHLLLGRHGLSTTLGHLDQAITAHAKGDWAAANGQLRTSYESLFDEIACVVDPAARRRLKPGEPRRQYLANLDAPLIRRDLNEWSDDGKNLVNGILKRLHPQGPHPGLSDGDDSTFRLHLVLLTARLFLRRLDAAVGDGCRREAARVPRPRARAPVPRRRVQ